MHGENEYPITYENITFIHKIIANHTNSNKRNIENKIDLLKIYNFASLKKILYNPDTHY